MRFGQNVLRMTEKDRFVQFSWKAHCFPGLKRIWGQCDDFENFDAHKCDLAKTCCAWPEKNVCTIFTKSALFSLFGENLRQVWRSWQLWRSEMRKGQNVPRMTWKEGCVQFLWKAHRFPVLERMLGQCDDFDNFDAHKCDLGKTCCAWPKRTVLYNFHGKRTVFPYWRKLKRSVTILRTLTLKNAIWPNGAAHDLKRAFCTIFIKSAVFSLFGENFRPVWRFWDSWPSKIRFGQNVLLMTWKEGFVQFSWKAHFFAFLERIWGKCDEFDNFDAQKCDLAKACSAWSENSVLYNFHGKRTVFPFRREFQASGTILGLLTLKNPIWPKRAAHDLKRGFCTIFMKSALFCLFGENYGKRTVFPLWREC